MTLAGWMEESLLPNIGIRYRRSTSTKVMRDSVVVVVVAVETAVAANVDCERDRRARCCEEHRF